MIGVFDSGVGGLSVLRALRLARPDAPVVYVSDAAFAPYGGRDDDYLLDRANRVTQWLVEHGAVSVVVACNTATAAAIDNLRSTFADIDFVGVEPGLKPAAAASKNRRIGVLATRATLRSSRYARLKQQVLASHPDQTLEFFDQGCPGLADAIEHRNEQLASLLQAYCRPLLAADVDTVVLGCTHYPLAGKEIAQVLGSGVRVIDTSAAVARHAAARHPVASQMQASGGLELRATGHVEALTRAARIWVDPACAPASMLEI
jgi:glutamate racemase